MPKFETLKADQLGLIAQDENGIIYQIALTEQQSQMINAVAAMMSEEKPLVRLPKEYDLKLAAE